MAKPVTTSEELAEDYARIRAELMREGREIVTLGDIESVADWLEIECLRCQRYGRYAVARLIEAHGRKFTLPSVPWVKSQDCPRRQANSEFDRCGARFKAAAKDGTRDVA